MSRATIILATQADRSRAAEWVAKAPWLTSVTFKRNRRSVDQNSRMWAMLGEVARQAIHQGRRYTSDEWKVIFLHALGQEMRFLPSLDGTTFVPYGSHSSDLTKDEMSNLIELIAAWGAEHGVVFNEPERAVA